MSCGQKAFMNKAFSFYLIMHSKSFRINFAFSFVKKDHQNVTENCKRSFGSNWNRQIRVINLQHMLHLLEAFRIMLSFSCF